MAKLHRTMLWLKRTIWGVGVPIRTLMLELLVAVSLAFLAWLYMHSRQESSLDQVEVPIHLTLASADLAKFELKTHGAARIPMSFTGPPSRIRELRRLVHLGRLEVRVQVRPPGGSASVTHDEVRIDPESVPTPPGVATVLVPGRNSVRYSLHRLVERHLPVQLKYTGDMRISKVKLRPATVLVRGPKEVLDSVHSISTQSYDFTLPAKSTGDASIEGQASLVSELEGRPIQTTPASISVGFRAHPRKKIYQLRDVPVRFLCPPEFAWTPRFEDAKMAKLSVTVRGPTAEEPPSLLAFVDLCVTGLGTGRNVQPLRIQLPDGYQQLDEAPRLIAFYLDPVDRSKR